MNTANLQLEGVVMAMASISETLIAKGVLTRDELAASLMEAEKCIEEDEDRKLSDSNRAATLFPIRVLLLANQAQEQGKRLTFSDYAEMVGRLT